MDSADTNFDLACSRRIAWTLENWPTSESRGVKCSLHIDSSDTITLKRAVMVEGHPDMGLQQGPFTGEILASDNQPIQTFSFWDYRIELGETKVVSSEADFELIVPFHPGYSRLKLNDKKTGAEKLTISIDAVLCHRVAQRARAIDSDPLRVARDHIARSDHRVLRSVPDIDPIVAVRKT